MGRDIARIRDHAAFDCVRFIQPKVLKLLLVLPVI